MLHTIVAAGALALIGPQVGAPAPDFTLTTVSGKRVTLADYRGKTLVVNDWATWCPPCREEADDLIAVARREASRGVVFLGVDSTEQAPIVRAYVASKGVPYAQAIDDGSFSKAYDVRNFPTTVVIGPDGVLRARIVGTVDRATLTGFVAGARAGRNAVVATPAQKKVDRLLDPARFSFHPATATAARATAHAVLRAIDAAENVDGTSDYVRIQAEENVLRDEAAQALAPVATSDADRAFVARLRGDTLVARERWPQAIATYRTGLRYAPNDPDLAAGLARAYGGAHDRAEAAHWYAKVAELQPAVGAFIDLGDVLGKLGRYDDGAVAFSQAIGRAKAEVAAHPRDRKALRELAAAYLYQGRLYVRAGRTARARTAFANAAATAQRLPKSDSRYAMDLEEAQEAIVALDVARPASGRTTLSLTPWTGADLPGSIASTYKYRLLVAGTPGKSVPLAASGLPKRWIASFCSDGQCAPFRTTVLLPQLGVKVIEFQLVPESTLTAPATIRVSAGGTQTSVRVGGA
jgi:thiol-disulfide isomerase/thioredoxin